MSDQDGGRAGRAPAVVAGVSSAEGLPRSDRVRRRGEFLWAQRKGARVSSPHFVFMLVPGTATRCLGVTVSKRIGHAVARNRVKRVVREVFRRNRALFPERCRCVVLARPGAHELGYFQARTEVAEVAVRMRRAAFGAGS